MRLCVLVCLASSLAWAGCGSGSSATAGPIEANVRVEPTPDTADSSDAGDEPSHRAAKPRHVAKLPTEASGAPTVPLEPPTDFAALAKARDLFGQGMDALEKLDYPAALSSCQSAWDTVPKPQMLFCIGRAQLGLGKLQEGCASMERYWKEMPQNPWKKEKKDLPLAVCPSLNALP